MLLSAFLVMLFVSSTVYVFSDNSSKDSDEKTITFDDNDPLYQYEGHDHTNASQHEAGTDNMELLDFNPLSTPGNAEVQVATTPDGET